MKATEEAKTRRTIGDGPATDPLYAQVARVLKEEIVGGISPVGSLLPTEDELSARFAVSRYTVREALRRLREDGLVSSRQGAGTIVIPPASADSHVLQAMSINDLAAFASGTRLTIDAIKLVSVDAGLAAKLGIPAGDEWLAVRGFRHAEGVPIAACWTEYYIHRDFAAVSRLLQRHNGPIFPLIEDLFGTTIVEVEQEIGGIVIPPLLAERLEMEPGSVALEVRRTYRDPDGKVVQITVNTHPASRFRHSMTLRRVKA